MRLGFNGFSFSSRSVLVQLSGATVALSSVIAWRCLQRLGVTLGVEAEQPRRLYVGRTRR